MYATRSGPKPVGICVDDTRMKKQEQAAQRPVFQGLCGFSLIDSITREMVTGKRGNTIADPAAARSRSKMQAESTKRKAGNAQQKADALHSDS